MQLSPSLTKYVIGVGEGSGVKVEVGGGNVEVRLGVTVIVTVFVAVGGTITSGCDRNAMKTKPAPIVRNRASNNIATGKLRVTSGIRPLCTTFSGAVGFCGNPNSAPQTRHRVASTAMRVPHAGHSLVDVGVS